MRCAPFVALLVTSVECDFFAPSYVVDMDQDAYARWKPIADDLLQQHGYENAWGKLHVFLEDALAHDTWEELEPLWDRVLAGYPAEYQDEVFAFHRWMNEQHPVGGNWTLGQVVMVQLFYEVEDACTSIVAQHADGTIRHARNLDYGLPGLENFTATITLERRGVALARGTMYVGYCGLLTGQKLLPNGSAAWSLSLDQRFYGAKKVPYVGTIEALLAGVQNVGFTLRDALQFNESYATATAHLGTVEIPAPAYLIVAGTDTNEGAVITRDRNGTSKAAGTGRGFWPLDVDAGAWYRPEIRKGPLEC